MNLRMPLGVFETFEKIATDSRLFLQICEKICNFSSAAKNKNYQNSFLRQFLSKLLEPRFFSFHGLWFLTVTGVTADDDCAPEAAASWIQMKLHYDINEQSDEGTSVLDGSQKLSQAGRIPALKNFWG